MQTNPKLNSLYRINAPIKFEHSQILNPQVLEFITSLHRQFNKARLEILKDRSWQLEKFREGNFLEFNHATEEIRTSVWRVEDIPEILEDRKVEIVGGTGQKSLVNIFNSGAKGCVADADSAYTWNDQLEGQMNLYNILNGLLVFGSKNAGEKKPLLYFRPRGLHINENNLLIEDEPVSAALFDFGLYFFTNAENLISNGQRPCFYLPKLENYKEAGMWNRIFEFAECELELAPGTIKATVPIETISGIFQLEEIIYELRNRITGLNACFWNDAFRFLRNKNNGHPPIVGDFPLNLPLSFVDIYSRYFIKTCHKRNVHALGGLVLSMADGLRTEIRAKGDFAKVKDIFELEAEAGFDGSFVADIEFVRIANLIFEKYLKGREHQKKVKLQQVSLTVHNLLNPFDRLTSLFNDHKLMKRNLPTEILIDLALKEEDARVTDNGALAVTTGKFTGRCPDDKYIVRDEETENRVQWGKINNPLNPVHFDGIYKKMRSFVESKSLYSRDCYGGASENYRVKVEVVTTKAWQSLFAKNQFLNPSEDELRDFLPEWTIFCVPEFEADPTEDGTKRGNFTIINFSRKMVLIGGTEYAGEIKKSLFTVLNYLLPVHHDVLPMHCSATIGEKGDVALFFGLSGTGKTTLSADPTRCLIGDDEHGWSDEEIFNFEGGCYAKVINLDAEKEPRIHSAIRYGTLLENICFYPYSTEVNYHDDSLTENTRAAYPLAYADINPCPSVKAAPKNIFFLTADATGVLPPLAALKGEQVKAFFLTGYTSKVAGTEVGIVEPQPTFSACFGAAFLPLPPIVYADSLEKKIRGCNANVWLVNTGWTGGKYDTGHRMPLPLTRALINAVLNDALTSVEWNQHPVFGIAVPASCPGVESKILDPKSTWKDEEAYMKEAYKLLKAFVKQLTPYVGDESSAEKLFVVPRNKNIVVNA